MSGETESKQKIVSALEPSTAKVLGESQNANVDPVTCSFGPVISKFGVDSASPSKKQANLEFVALSVFEDKDHLKEGKDE